MLADIHTHILPGIDDGSKDPDMSLEMLRRQRDMGVGTVVLTPHFYRNHERPDHFFQRRREACHRLGQRLLELPEEERRSLPHLLLGAEVAWVPNLPDWDELEQFCFTGTRYLLLELPFRTWDENMLRQLYELVSKGRVTPIIAHLERYLKDQKPEHIQEILGLGVPVQVSAEPMLHFFQGRTVLRMLKTHEAQITASDCHNLTSRPPCLGPAMEVVERKLGAHRATSIRRHMCEYTEQDNQYNDILFQ